MKFLISLLCVTALSNCFADQEQKPVTCMWIGCSASKAVAGQTLNLSPDELCVQANLANLFAKSDPSAESALRHAVDAEKVAQIVVCGTYGCPGVREALIQEQSEGSWLYAVRQLYIQNKDELDKIPDETKRVNRLVELNVLKQVENVRAHPIVEAAGQRKQPLKIIGMVHDPRATSGVELICVQVDK